MKDIDGVVITQPTFEGPDGIVVSSTMDLSTFDRLSTVNPAVPNARPS